MRYIPNTPDDREAMLRDIGVSSFEELLTAIPEKLRLKRPLNLPAGKSEWEVRAHLTALARENLDATRAVSFAGGGSYDHFIPSAVDAVASRSEFVTAYTPYQPEVSQGTLQVIYEFQSMVCELFGMDVANASLYDAGSALAEAILLATSATRRKKVLIPDNVHPFYCNVARTLTANLGLEITRVPTPDGVVNGSTLQDRITDETAAVVLQYPNFFGGIENIRPLIERAHEQGALVIVIADPLAMGVLEPPGKWDADIVIGEGQGLGNPQFYGGPFLGLFAAKQKYARRMPGRIAGVTKDADGKRGFVLTLQTREQHIRRDKATSNICTNEGLCATRATIFLSLIGPTGLRTIGDACLRRCGYLRSKLGKLEGFKLVHAGYHFKEFVLRVPGGASRFREFMAERNILAGLPLASFGIENDSDLLVAVTESRSQEELDAYVQHAAEFASRNRNTSPRTRTTAHAK